MEKTVYFRAFEESDAPLIHQWKNSDEINELTVGLNKKTCLEEDLDWVKARMRHQPYNCFWAICAKDTDKMIGWCCLTDIHYINSSANFSGIVIADKDYRDGFAWIETYLFIYQYGFERLGLNRVYGESIIGNKNSNNIGKLLFVEREGVKREAVFKNGRFYDVAFGALLRKDYFEHKNNGDYEFGSIIKRLRAFRKTNQIECK